MRIRYNAPFTLTFSLACALILALDQFAVPNLIENFFTVGGQGSFRWDEPLSYWRLVGYSLGHADWAHLTGNLMTLILLGPILEEKYQTQTLFVMVLITAIVTAVVNLLLFPTALVGASGIVFLMILLASFANARSGEIPLTFLAVLALYLGQQVFDAFQKNNISEMAHIVGGICGSIFGFLALKFQDGSTSGPPASR